MQACNLLRFLAFSGQFATILRLIFPFRFGPLTVWAWQNLLVLSLLAEHDSLILWLQCTYLVTLLDSYKAA